MIQKKLIAVFVLLLSTLALAIYAKDSGWIFSRSDPGNQEVRQTQNSPISTNHEEIGRAMTRVATLRDTLPEGYDSYCPFGMTATGGGYYLVHVNTPDSIRSQHVRLDQAILSAAEAETVTPADSVWITHDFELRVECEVPEVAYLDSVSIHPRDTTVEVGDSIQMTALLWMDGEVVGCAGNCAAYETSSLPFRQAVRMCQEAAVCKGKGSVIIEEESG